MGVSKEDGVLVPRGLHHNATPSHPPPRSKPASMLCACVFSGVPTELRVIRVSIFTSYVDPPY